jgi:6-phosphogluconolactonase
MTYSPEIRILDTAADLFQAAAAEFSALANEAVRRSGRFCVALSGGSTPKGLFSLLAGIAGASIPWDKMYFFWSDERHVPPGNAESNYRMANEAMLSKIPARPENIFRIHSEEKDAKAAAAAYDQTLRTFFRLTPGEFPRFDLILLGLGPEGHVASLFPDSLAMGEKTRLVVANWVEKFKTDRITFTLPAINHAACVTFLVSGGEKAEILRDVLENPTLDLPAQRVHPVDGKLIWLADRAAAAALKKRNP